MDVDGAWLGVVFVQDGKIEFFGTLLEQGVVRRYVYCWACHVTQLLGVPSTLLLWSYVLLPSLFG